MQPTVQFAKVDCILLSIEAHRGLVIGIPQRWIPICAGDVLEVGWTGDDDLRGASAGRCDLRSTLTDEVTSHEEEDGTDDYKNGKYNTDDGGGRERFGFFIGNCGTLRCSRS